MVLDMDVVDTVSTRDPLMPTMEATDMVVTDVDMEVMVDTDTVDTVARDLLMPTTDPLDTDTAPDTDLDTDMVVMVLDMDMVDTVSTRDPLMPTMEATDMV